MTSSDSLVWDQSMPKICDSCARMHLTGSDSFRMSQIRTNPPWVEARMFPSDLFQASWETPERSILYEVKARCSVEGSRVSQM